MRALLLVVCLVFARPAVGASDSALFDWQQHPGAAIPADPVLRDETGQVVRFGSLFRGVPVILDLGYFHCPTLCGVVRADLMNSIGASGLRAGRDYVLAAVSIDPSETVHDAAAAKSKDLASREGGAEPDWHYLTGAVGVVSRISAAVGFHAEYDPRLRQFMHPTGLVILNGEGRVSSYLLGVGYSGGDLRTAVIRARNGGIARAALPVLLLCFHFDQATGHYTLAIMKLLRLFGVLTVLTLIGLFVILSRSRPRGPA